MKTILVYESGDRVEYTGKESLPVRWQFPGTTRRGVHFELEGGSPMYDAVVTFGLSIPYGTQGEVLDSDRDLVGFYPVRFHLVLGNFWVSIECLVNVENLRIVRNENEGNTSLYATVKKDLRDDSVDNK